MSDIPHHSSSHRDHCHQWRLWPASSRCPCLFQTWLLPCPPVVWLGMACPWKLALCCRKRMKTKDNTVTWFQSSYVKLTITWFTNSGMVTAVFYKYNCEVLNWYLLSNVARLSNIELGDGAVSVPCPSRVASHTSTVLLQYICNSRFFIPFSYRKSVIPLLI